MVFANAPQLFPSEILEKFLNSEGIAFHFDTGGGRLRGQCMLRLLGSFARAVDKDRVCRAGAGSPKVGRCGRERFLGLQKDRASVHYQEKQTGLGSCSHGERSRH